MASHSESSSSEEGRTVISTMVAVDNDKNSQYALKWAVDNLKLKDNKIAIVHVTLNNGRANIPKEGREPTQAEMKQLFNPFRIYCARKGIRVKEFVLQGPDIASTLTEYINANSVNTIVFGASDRGAIARAFKNADVPTVVAKHAPDSCSVYAITKGKVLKLRSSNESPTPSRETISMSQCAFPAERPNNSNTISQEIRRGKNTGPLASECSSNESIAYGSSYNSNHNSGFGEYELGNMIPSREQDINKISTSKQPMNNINLQDHTKQISFNYTSGSSDLSEAMSFPSDVSLEILDQLRVSYSSRSSTSSQRADIEDELRRLKQELKQITDMYLGACQEAVTGRGQVRDIVQWKREEGNKLEDANNAKESAMAILDREKQRCKAAVEAAQMAQRIAELETEKRKRAEMRFQRESEEKNEAIKALAHSEIRYRKYTIGEIEVATDYYSGSKKIGEGGYGPVFQATLDHTPVAIKVLRPDMSQGEKQFQKEIEVLSRMRHPHMVILLGACPENGCLVYEFMDNGSLEDRLYLKDSTPPLSWSTRFRIAAEIGTALNFLHRTRPEPLVHRDLKPANILLDKNYVSKIGDVGLSRLIPTQSNSFTQYCMTAAAGTFCYIDPEYQQTGMLGTKSDIYSLGVILLQLITARPPMGLTHCVESAIETGKFEDVLDPTVNDWPVLEALSLAKLGLKCCELRRKDRPDLEEVILPELARLRDLGSTIKSEGGYDYDYSQIQSFQGNTYLGQQTRNGNSGAQIEIQSKYAYGSSSTMMTSDTTD